jgi:hypothetical protein
VKASRDAGPECRDHRRPARGVCVTCGRPACDICLSGSPGPGYACPGCGGSGAALYDTDDGDLERVFPRADGT